MGSFGCYYGNYHIPEEKRKVFRDQMMKVLNYGGMMSFAFAHDKDFDIPLLVPAEVKGDGECVFWYNYFEDNPWETASFSADDCILMSEKLGSAEFCDVMLAAYFLYEEYDPEPGYVMVNGDPMDPTRYLGWLNHLLGTEFSMEKRFRLWEIFEASAGEDGKDISGVKGQNLLRRLIPERLSKLAEGTELTDIQNILNGTTYMERNVFKVGTYQCDVAGCRNALKAYIAGKDQNIAMQEIIDLVKKKKTERAALSDPDIASVAAYTIFLPACVILYLSAELVEKEFWHIWSKEKEFVYHDETPRRYTPLHLERKRLEMQMEPVPPIATNAFLGYSDFDRLYWWDGSDEVMISERTDKWLSNLAKAHREIMTGLGEESDGLAQLIGALKNADSYYKRIYPFQSMFTEFAAHVNEKEFLAATKLFRRLMEQDSYRTFGAVIERVNGSWDIADRRLTYNPARLSLKRYLSVMANKPLREKYFGF